MQSFYRQGVKLITYDKKETTLEQVLGHIHTFQKNQNMVRRPLRKEEVDEPEDLPLGLQVYRLGGLALIVLGILVHRLLRRNSQASPPWLFNLSAASIIAGSYPFFRSGLQKVPFLKRPGHDF